MTAQGRDSIIYTGKVFELLSSVDYPDSLLEDDRESPTWGSVCSGNWKGFFATWAIDDNKLFLHEIRGSKRAKVSLPALAEWVSGYVAIPTGSWLKNTEGSLSLYKKELHFKIVKGLVDGTHEVMNGMPTDKETQCDHCQRLLYYQGVIDL